MGSSPTRAQPLFPTVIWFISDAHFGHRNVANFGGRPISGPDDNVRWITECWQSLVSNKTALDRADRVYCLGDMAFDEDSLHIIRQLNGIKFLIKGNHCHSSELERDVYATVEGFFRYKGMWLSHCPIHEAELRGTPNVHGHTHMQDIPDPRYFNVCVESLYAKFGRPMISLDEIRGWVDSQYSPLHA